MEDSLNEKDDLCIEQDSLSSDSFSKDSLLNGHNTDKVRNTSTEVKRRGSYTLESSPSMITSVMNACFTTPLCVTTSNSQRPSLAAGTNAPGRIDMTQSMYERPWVTAGKNTSLAKAHAKQREEKLRLAREEHERKQKQKMAVLTESEKTAQNARKRKDAEFQRKMEETKKKALERQRIVEERKERLQKAEEARRKMLLQKLVNVTGKRPSPQASSNMMTMSCYGGFGSARSRPGNKEIVHSRFQGNRPVSSTGKVIGFGSSSPRNICETGVKHSNEHKKIPEAILIKCDLLSRPLSSRVVDRMTTSVISPPVASAASRLAQRQSSLRENNPSKATSKPSAMTTSMIDFTSKNKSNPHFKSKMKGELTQNISLANKRVNNKGRDATDVRPSSSSSMTPKKADDRKPTKSGPAARRARRSKVDTHLDSDSIDEEGSMIVRPVSENRTANVHEEMRDTAMDRSITNDSEGKIALGRALPTKDLSESDYKARLMENRRLVREKREKEREQFLRAEREKRHTEGMAAREMAEMEREKNSYMEDVHFTTSNDDTLDGPVDPKEYEVDVVVNGRESVLSEISETPSGINGDTVMQSVRNDEAKSERKKKIDSIMSRVRRPNEESSSDGGISPRRAMSPEPAELEPEVNNMAAVPAFKSSLLQSMMNRGRLAKSAPPSKGSQEVVATEVPEITLTTGPSNTVLSSVRESMEDSESLQTNINSPSSAAIRSSGVEGNSLSDANSEFAPEPLLVTFEEGHPEKDSTLSYGVPSIDREDCDGKEDSLSISEVKIQSDFCKDVDNSIPDEVVHHRSQSSTETEEEEEIMKGSFQMDDIFGASNMQTVSQEACVYQQ